nr:uncharacterized protein LOC128692022 [Cherax quadricarinatus]
MSVWLQMILCVVVVVVVPAAGDPVSLPQDVHSNTIFTSPTSEHFLSSNGPSSDTKTHNTYFSNSDTYLPRTHLNPSFSDTNQQSTILHSFSDTHQHNIHLHHSEIDQHNIHIHSSSDTNQHSTYSDSSNTYRHSTHLLDTHKDTITYMSDDILQNLPVVAIAERLFENDDDDNVIVRNVRKKNFGVERNNRRAEEFFRLVAEADEVGDWLVVKGGRGLSLVEVGGGSAGSEASDWFVAVVVA